MLTSLLASAVCLTLGGDCGPLKYSLTIISLWEVQMVLAESEVVWTSRRGKPDRSWAVRCAWELAVKFNYRAND